MPSVWPETFGLVISEAWDARRPVLGARTGGIGGRIAHGVNGLTFQPGSPEALADLMLEALGNAPLWQSLSGGIADEIPVVTAWDRHRAILDGLPRVPA